MKRPAARAEKTASRSGKSAAKRNRSPRQETSSSSDVRRFALQQDNHAISRWLDSPGSSRALMDLVHDAIIIRNPASRVESWNASAARLYGWTAKEAVGKINHTLLDTTFPNGLEAANDALFHGGYWEGELHHRRKDGTRIVVESRQSLLRDASGKPLLIKEINRDVTQQRRQLSYLRLLGEVSACVNEAETVEEALRRSLASICVQTNWCVACACTANRGNNEEIQGDRVWFLSDEKRFAHFRDAVDAKLKFPREKNVAERVFRKNGPVWIRDIHKDPYFAAVLSSTGAALQCAYGFPIPLGSKAGIVMVLFSDAPMELDEAFSGTMSGVGRHLGRLFERLGAEKTQRALSVSLMRAQDDERRRIARELHDSTGQYLAALTLAIDAARNHRDALPAAATRKLEEASEIINRCSAEVRTLSHLLHPPLLEELGLASAINWYVDGFAERSGMKLDVQVPAQVARLDPFAELALFRALQECLTNIHRHSGSKTASVKIEADDHHLTLEVRDQGKGIEQETLGDWFGNKKRSGVGISGMRERMKDLGGTLEIESSSAGTVVRATIPARQRAAAAVATEAVAPAAASKAATSRAKAIGVAAK
ncbi:MAG: ATP-binding protein [Candidatus Acidiferrales bacterium]